MTYTGPCMLDRDEISVPDPEMESLDINLTKDSSLRSMLFTVCSTVLADLKENHIILWF
jgi:hypothetical protein